MKVAHLTSILLLLFSLEGFSQINDDNPVWNFSANLSGGISKFHVANWPDHNDYSTVEFTIGALASRNFKNTRMSLTFGLAYSEKFKRKSYYDFHPQGGVINNGTSTSPFLDESVSSTNMRSLNLPITLNFKVGKSYLISAGLQGRFWLFVESNRVGVVNNGEFEYGAILSFHRAIYKNWYLGLTGYSALVSIFEGSAIVSNTGLIEYNVINQYLQLSVRYQF